MIKNHIIMQLRERGLISNITNEASLIENITKQSIYLYCGFDPTADSLHLGHLIPLACLRHFQLAGHCPIILIGGATSLIGDPSFKSTERKINYTVTNPNWIKNIINQISLFLDFNCGNNSAIIVNNYDWFHTMNILTFLRNIGKYFSINQMIHKKIIKHRLNNNGISFTEFTYNILQAYDFAYLYKQYGTILQIGGSDQWGNITSGIHLIKRLYKKLVYGLTVPIATKADGTKFGKTEQEPIWLDPHKTSPYKFYQFWMNTDDTEVYRLLKLFTFIKLSEIEEIKESKSILNQSISTKTRMQHILAEHMTYIVHGIQGLETAKRITTSLFSNSLYNLTKDDFLQLSQDHILTIILKNKIDLQQALVQSKLASSRREARTMINANAISINGQKQTSTEYIFHDSDKLYGCYTLLCRGKKYYCLLHWK